MTRVGLAVALTLAACGARTGDGTMPDPDRAMTFYVAPDGDDEVNDGSKQRPFRSLQAAADTVIAGDTVVVTPGSYDGFRLRGLGTEKKPITFRAEGRVVIDTPNLRTPDGIDVEDSRWIVLEGFEVTNVPRAGIRVVGSNHVTVRKTHAHDNGRWGIFTAHCDDLLIEDNETSGSKDEHGIYVSNSGDRPIIRRNQVHDNVASGIHMNADARAGGDGIISNAVVEENVIYGNGKKGGSGINMDGVHDSIVRNNLLYGNFASGISMFGEYGAEPSRRNLVVNNTIVQAAGSRWAINLKQEATGNRLLNNILIHPGTRGSINAMPETHEGLVSDHNIMSDRFSVDDGETMLDFEGWRRETRLDESSAVANAEVIFRGDSDFHLAERSPAIDAGGEDDGAPGRDLEGKDRTGRPDAGAYEYGAGGRGGGGAKAVGKRKKKEPDADADADDVDDGIPAWKPKAKKAEPVKVAPKVEPKEAEPPDDDDAPPRKELPEGDDENPLLVRPKK